MATRVAGTLRDTTTVAELDADAVPGAPKAVPLMVATPTIVNTTRKEPQLLVVKIVAPAAEKEQETAFAEDADTFRVSPRNPAEFITMDKVGSIGFGSVTSVLARLEQPEHRAAEMKKREVVRSFGKSSSYDLNRPGFPGDSIL